MKKISIVIVALLFAGNMYTANAQDKMKEGKIIFDISYESEMSDQQMAMMPTDMTVYFKDEKSRGEMQLGGLGSVTTISDHKTGDSYSLMDIMGKKTAIKTTKEETEKDKLKKGKPEVKITDETKKFAGYSCTKAIVTYKDEKPVNIWFTKELDAFQSSKYSIEGIDGFMMEWGMKQQGVEMKMTCKSVEKATVSDDKFVIPEGYKVMTMEEMMKQGGAGH